MKPAAEGGIPRFLFGRVSDLLRPVLGTGQPIVATPQALCRPINQRYYKLPILGSLLILSLSACSATLPSVPTEVRVPVAVRVDEELDGLALARHIEADLRWRKIPVLAVTALGAAADYIRTWAHGFAGHLVKPIEPETLIQAIRVLTRHRA